MANFSERNQNSVPALTAKSNAGDNADVIVWADPSTHRLLVNATTSISGGNKTNNNAAPTNDNLGVLPAVANAAAPTYTEGNQVLLSTDLTGALRVTGSLSVGGTTDNSAFTAGSSTGTPAMGFYHSTIDTVTDGRAAAVAITNKRAMYVSLFDTAGNALLGSNASASSIPVVIASDQGAVAVSQSGTWNVGTVTTVTTVTTVATLTSITNNVNVVGTKTNNNAAPGATNVGTLPALANAALPSWTEGNQVSLSVDLSGRARIVQPDQITTATAITTQNLNLFSGTATANSTVASATLNASGTVAFQIRGTYTGVLLVQATVDGTNWVNVGSIVNVGTTATMSALTSGVTGIFQVDSAGFTQVRVTAQTQISGTATVTIESTAGNGMLGIDTAVILDQASAPTITSFAGQRRATEDNPRLSNQMDDLITLMQSLNDFFVNNGNATRMLDGYGREQVNVSGDVLVSSVTISASTAETTLIPAFGNRRTVLVGIIIANTSASTNTRVEIRDAKATPDGIQYFQSVGGSVPVGFMGGGMRIPQRAPGQPWTATTITSTTDVRITAYYVLQ